MNATHQVMSCDRAVQRPPTMPLISALFADAYHRDAVTAARGLRQVGPLLIRMMGLLPRETRLCHPAESRIADLRLATRPMAACCASKICAVGRSHDVSSNEPARTPRNAPATLGAPVTHDPQSGQTQRGYTRPLSAVRSTTWGSPAVRWNASSMTTAVMEKALAVIFWHDVQ